MNINEKSPVSDTKSLRLRVGLDDASYLQVLSRSKAMTGDNVRSQCFAYTTFSLLLAHSKLRGNKCSNP